jgi:two-component system, sensor histidine kinase and response regulator
MELLDIPSGNGNRQMLDVRSTKLPLEILVVEDTLANQKLVMELLAKRGHQVAVASDGREAIKLVQEQAFDVILMDVQMPYIDGLQATAAIREAERKSVAGRVPIVAITAHALPEDEQRCLDAGMDAYVAKPIDGAKLVELVERLGWGDSHGSSAKKVAHKSAAKESPNSAPVLDLASAMARLGGDRRLFRDMVEFFREDAHRLLDEIRAGVAEQDVASAALAAHTLKSMAATCGGERAARFALEVERLGNSGDLSGVEQMLIPLEDAVADLEQALEPMKA